MTTKKTDVKDLVSKSFCRWIGHSEPTVCRNEDELGLNLFVYGPGKARIKLMNETAEIVNPHAVTVGTFSMNVLDGNSEIKNLSLAPNDDGDYFPVTRNNSSFWSCGVVETKEANASEIAEQLRNSDRHVCALSASDALAWAETNDPEAAAVLQALAAYSPDRNSPAVTIMGELRAEVRYDLDKMLILLEKSGAPSLTNTIYTNLSKDQQQQQPAETKTLDRVLGQRS
jgi:hypothetical protein